MRPRHLALPACLCAGSAGLANAFGVGSARRLRIAFRSTAFSPKSDARTRAHSKSPATAGRNTTGENLRKLREFSSIVVRRGEKTCPESREETRTIRMTKHE